MFLERRPIHHQIRPLLQKKATGNWYRTVRFKNLTERAEWVMRLQKKRSAPAEPGRFGNA
jgi:hypothetical protein